jgi:hypothetical protein
MNFCLRVVTSLVAVLSPCWADNAGRLRQTLLSALNDQISLSRADQQQIMDVAHDLKPNELRSLLPLGMDCLRSPHWNARDAGIDLFREAFERPNDSVLLEPYISDFADCLKVSQCFYQRWAVLWLLSTTNPPKPSKAAAAILVSNLEEERRTRLMIWLWSRP